nr:hypothetical protein [Tanacetum cinerariifolium]
QRRLWLGEGYGRGDWRMMVTATEPRWAILSRGRLNYRNDSV